LEQSSGPSFGRSFEFETPVLTFPVKTNMQTSMNMISE
jgi:hypothetical protein